MSAYLASLGLDVAVCERERFQSAEEPGMGSLYRKVRRRIRLVGASEFASSAVVLLALDTPIGKCGKGNYEAISRVALRLRGQMKRGSVLLISSQVKHGFCERLVDGRVGIAYWPENIRRGRALQSLAMTGFYTVGVDGRRTAARLRSFFSSIPAEIRFCDLRSAEATKVFLNAFLAACVSYANEMARLCSEWGVSSEVVHTRLVRDYRIGRLLPLEPGRPYLGPLERDIEQLRGDSRLFREVKRVNEGAKLAHLRISP